MDIGELAIIEFKKKQKYMSYLQINIGGKERGLKFNQLAIETIAKYNDAETISGLLYAMIYGGLKANAYVKREEPDFTFEQVCDWVDELENKEEISDNISRCVMETQSWKNLTKSAETENVEEEKKA